jgi:hypothetical protein
MKEFSQFLRGDFLKKPFAESIAQNNPLAKLFHSLDKIQVLPKSFGID